jgi:hypothetical protein
MEKGVGAAWGLPLVREGKNRYSALAVSRALKRSGKAETREGHPGPDFSGGAELPDGNFFGREELAAIGVGPLGRYVGGEPIKPLPLKPERFFETGYLAAGKIPGGIPAGSSARSFFSGVEFEKDLWCAGGDLSSLFHFHMEFLRTWGFSGGSVVPGETAGENSGGFLAAYLRFLHKENYGTGGKILAVMERLFFEKSLLPLLPEASPFASAETGKIPLNNAEGEESLLAAGITGTGIMLYETLPPGVKALKARCDILLAVETEHTDPAAFSLLGEIDARLRLGILIAGKDSGGFKNSFLKKTGFVGTSAETETRLFRNLVPSSSGGKPPPLPLKPARPASGKAGPSGNEAAWFSPDWLRKTPGPGREEAAALGLLPQWEAGRVEAAGGAVIAVHSRFAGIRVSDFRDEQALYYGEAAPEKYPVEETAGERERSGKEPAFAAPPESGEAAFERLDGKQREFFLYWRDQCRRGNYIFAESSESMVSGLEYYIEIYARELVLSMGNEAPMEGFLALRELLREYGASRPALEDFLFRLLVDFAAIYGIGNQAFGLLFDRIPPLIEKQKTAGKSDPALRTILDLALFRFFVTEKRRPGNDGETDEYLLPFIKALLPRKVRKGLAEKEAEEKFGGALVLLDKKLREDWDSGLFEFFCPPIPLRSDFRAFEKCPGVGASSYTVFHFGFSGHVPLVSTLESLVLNPDSAGLFAGSPAGEFSFNLETDLLAELRRESDEVRELLTTRELRETGPGREDSRNERRFLPEAAGGEAKGTSATPCRIPDKMAMAEFTASLSGADIAALGALIEDGDIGDLEAERINAAFNGRFGDLLVVYEGGKPSIPGEYLSILKAWKSRNG